MSNGSKLFIAFSVCVMIFSEASAFTININSEGGTVGERVEGFTGGAAGNTLYTDEESYSGVQAMKLTANEGSTGFGTLGGIINFQTHPAVGEGEGRLGKGDELWIRTRLFFPEGFEFKLTGRQKFLRVRVYHDEDGKRTSEGYNDLYINPRVEQENFRPFMFIFEGQQQWQAMGTAEDFFPRGEWRTVEYYLKLDNVTPVDGGTARVRVWVDGELIGETEDRRTLNREDSYVNSFNFFTYWGNELVHKTQSFYADDLTITTDTPDNVDAHGNPYIGMESVGDPAPAAANESEPETLTSER